MGGKLGYQLHSRDIEDLEKIARQSLTEARSSSSRHVFISFDHEDMNDVNLLRAQAKNSNSDLEFDDYSLKEPFDSKNADYIKQQIRNKINFCSVTMVYLSENTASSKWVNWEIEESIKRAKGVIGVYQGDKPPANLPPAFQKYGCKIVKWNHIALMDAIEEASIERV